MMSKNRKVGWVCIILAYMVTAFGVGVAIGTVKAKKDIVGIVAIADMYRKHAEKFKEQGYFEISSILYTVSAVIESGDEERFSLLTSEYSKYARQEIKNRRLLQKKFKP